MSLRAWRLAIPLLLAVWLTGCGADVESVSVSESDSGQAIGLRVGQDLYVTVPSNPSTGYAWVIDITAEDVLRAVGEPRYVPDQPELVGSGGNERFHFRGQTAGRAVIQMEYRQEWDAASPADRPLVYTVTVR